MTTAVGLDSGELVRPSRGRTAWVGFISALVALAAYSGAAVSAISTFTETFRIEDRAAEAYAAGVTEIAGELPFGVYPHVNPVVNT